MIETSAELRHEPAESEGGDVRHGTPDSDARPIRVVQIITTLARGGAQATVLASTLMADHGVEVSLLAGDETWSEGDHWDEARAAGLPVSTVPGLRRRPGPVADARALWHLVRHLRRIRPDLVHTHSTKAGILGRLAAAALRIPRVHTVHGWGPMHDRSRVTAKIAATIERSLAPLAGALVVVGENDRVFGLESGVGRPEQYRLIRSGIELDPVDGDPSERLVRDEEARRWARSELGLGPGFVIGMVARMATGQKDHIGLIEAFIRADLGSAQLVLVGDGSARPQVEAEIERRGVSDRVHLVGARPDAGRLVAAFDVSVLASWYEGMPRTVLEAVAVGVPVVSTDVGSVGRLIENDVTGRLVSVGDPVALAAALQDAHDRPATSRRMADRARGRVDEYSADRMRRDLAALWTEVAAGNHRTGSGR